MDEMKNIPTSETPELILPPEKKTYTFSKIETVFAWFCFLAGYLFFRTLPLESSRLGGLLLILLLFTVTAVLFHVQRISVPPVAAVVSASVCVLSFSMILCANGQVRALVYMLALLTFLYLVGSANSENRRFSWVTVLDYFNAAFVLPFCSLTSAFHAAFSGRAAKSSGKTVLRILSGIFLALVPTVIVAVLLSYDDGFTDLMHRIFSADISIMSIFSQLQSISLGFFAGVGLFSLYTTAAKRNGKDSPALTPQDLEKAARVFRRLPALTVLTAALPLLFLYVVFFISQWGYYISAFTGTLPENLSYARYAREGFFQLCAVSVINLIVLTAAVLLMRRKEEKPPALLKGISAVYSLFTLILIATAISKMALYIDAYGLTKKRVYASVFMILLAILFTLILVKQFFTRLKATAIVMLSGFAILSVLALGNADAYIARYNVDRYLDGTLAEVDIGALAELGDAAIPQLVRLAQIEAEKLGTDVKTMLERHHTSAMRNRLSAVLKTEAMRFTEEDTFFFGFNIPERSARKALTDAGLIG